MWSSNDSNDDHMSNDDLIKINIFIENLNYTEQTYINIIVLNKL